MAIRFEWWVARLVVVGLMVYAYFIFYPQDLAAVVNPLERLLRISSAVSPGLSAVVGVATGELPDGMPGTARKIRNGSDPGGFAITTPRRPDCPRRPNGAARSPKEFD